MLSVAVQLLLLSPVDGRPKVFGGILWKVPFKIDLTGKLRPGVNQVAVKVTNLWVNRMIGDRQPDVEHTYTFTSPVFYGADSKLLPSGLLGPVTLGISTPVQEFHVKAERNND